MLLLSLAAYGFNGTQFFAFLAAPLISFGYKVHTRHASFPRNIRHSHMLTWRGAVAMTHTVLIVDDDPDVLDVIASMLENIG